MQLFNSKNDSQQKEKRAVFKYFEIIFSKASKLIQLNLIYFACILPIFCGALYFACIIFDVSAELIEQFYFLHLSVWLTANIPFPVFVILLMVSLILYGPFTAGFTYCIRNIATEKHFWISDFFEQAKKNFKQGIVFGIIDMVVFFSCLMYLAANTSGLEGTQLVVMRITQIFSLIITVLYIWVRFYSYTISVTFELKISDIFKNCFILLWHKKETGIKLFYVLDKSLTNLPERKWYNDTKNIGRYFF